MNAFNKSAQKELSLLLKLLPTFPTFKKKYPAFVVELGVVTGPEMKAINGKTRGKRKVTDVLSFPAPRIFQSQGLLGELLLCKEVVRAQARECGHSVRDEVRVLLVHGVLHLMGFDHEVGPAEAQKMRRWERRVLSRWEPSLVGLIDRVPSDRVGPL